MSYKLYHELHDKFAATDISHDFIHSHILQYCTDMIKKGIKREASGSYERVIMIVKYLDIVMEIDRL